MAALRARCGGGERLIGTFLAIPHPVAVEVTAAAGPDFVCIDGEHAQIGRGDLENLVRAADIHRVPTLVRVAGHAPEQVAAVLDAGATGVLVPRVSNAAEAAAAVAAARYPPAGRRGVGPGRASGYGYRIPDYMDAAGRDTLVAVQVETAEGLANAAAIAATAGVDVVFVGPGDLSVSLGALGPEGAERLDAGVGTILAAARAAGRTAGMFCAKPADVGRWAARGTTFFLLASDTMFLGAAAASAFAAARSEAASGQEKPQEPEPAAKRSGRGRARPAA